MFLYHRPCPGIVFCQSFCSFLIVLAVGFSLPACSSSGNKDEEEEPRKAEPQPSVQKPPTAQPISKPLKSTPASRPQPMEDETIEAMRMRLDRLIVRTDATLPNMSDAFELSAFPQLDQTDLRLRLARQSSVLSAVRERLIAPQPLDFP